MGRRTFLLALAALWCAFAAIAYADPPTAPSERPLTDIQRKIVEAAKERTTHDVTYDGRYVVIPYPGGDVPADRGVCTDEVIRILRAVGYDLQKLVHEDMRRNFAAYPNLWGRTEPDRNIDHRRVPNLMAFFKRQGSALPMSQAITDYDPGDIVAWRLPNGLTHIGVLVDVRSAEGRPLAVHNIGAGPKMEDVLFEWEIIGHYRYPKAAP
jgi:uncharacterized protein YijF (DUF1287 family)